MSEYMGSINNGMYTIDDIKNKVNIFTDQDINDYQHDSAIQN